MFFAVDTKLFVIVDKQQFKNVQMEQDFQKIQLIFLKSIDKNNDLLSILLPDISG